MEPRNQLRKMLLVGLLAAIAMAAIYLDTVFRELQEFRHLTKRELIVLGKPTEHQAEFIARISRDLAVKKEVRLILGPPPMPRGRLAESGLAYHILIEEKFFLGLTDMEQKALIAQL